MNFPKIRTFSESGHKFEHFDQFFGISFFLILWEEIEKLKEKNNEMVKLIDEKNKEMAKMNGENVGLKMKIVEVEEENRELKEKMAKVEAYMKKVCYI